MYKTGLLLAVALMLANIGIFAEESPNTLAGASYTGSALEDISPNPGILTQNFFRDGSLTNPLDDDCNIKLDGKGSERTLTIETVNQGSFVSRSFELPEIKKGQSKTLFLRFDEEFDIQAEDAANIYAQPKGGEKYLLDVRGGRSAERTYALDITSFAGQNVTFTFEIKSSGKPASWKIKRPVVLQNMELRGQIKSITTKYIEPRDHQFVYVDLNVSGSCPKIDSFTEMNFTVKEEDKTRPGIWNAQSIYMFAAPGEATNIAALDIVICVDISESMQNRIDDIESGILAFLDKLENSGIDHRVGFITFGNEVKPLADGLFLANSTFMETAAKSIGDYADANNEDEINAENQFGALNVAAEMKFRPEAKKAVIMFTDDQAIVDASSTNPPNQTSAMCRENIRKFGIAFYPVFDLYDGIQRDQYIDLTDDEENVNCSGKFYHIDNDLNMIIDDMTDELIDTYKLMYRVDNTDQSDKHRNVRVNVSYDTIIK